VLQCVAVCCSMLPCCCHNCDCTFTTRPDSVAVCCIVLNSVAVLLQRRRLRISEGQTRLQVCCSVLQYVVAHIPPPATLLSFNLINTSFFRLDPRQPLHIHCKARQCCSVLQCVAVCCSVLQCVAMLLQRRRLRIDRGSTSVAGVL